MRRRLYALNSIVTIILFCLACAGCKDGFNSIGGTLTREETPAQTEVVDARPNQPIAGRVALVIGNANYKNGNELKNPVHDAEDMAAALQRLGFEVLLRTDLDKNRMDGAISEFIQKSYKADVAMFFYAGHGVQNKNRNYMIPVNATFYDENTLVGESVSVSSLLDELDMSGSSVKIVMLDACRNNPLDLQTVRAVRGLSRTKVAKGTLIVYATEPGKVAEDGLGRNGLLTQGMLTALQGNDLNLGMVLETAGEEVERASENRQVLYADGPETLKKRFSFSVSQ